jgi:hypothetical protein
MEKRLCVCAVTIFMVSQLSGAAMLDLTTLNSTGIINAAIFNQLNSTNSTGSGVFDSFLRIQGANDSSERGYNTDGQIEFDTKGGTFTHSVLLSDIPVIIIGGVAYREFCLDINQDKKESYLSIDELILYIESAGNLTGYPANFSQPIYNLDADEDNWVKMDYSLNAGSGKADMDFLVPSALFGSDDSKYVYLYSQMGINDTGNDGFEEWGIVEGGAIPEPTTMSLLVLGTLGLLSRKK